MVACSRQEYSHGRDANDSISSCWGYGIAIMVKGDEACIKVGQFAMAEGNGDGFLVHIFQVEIASIV